MSDGEITLPGQVAMPGPSGSGGGRDSSSNLERDSLSRKFGHELTDDQRRVKYGGGSRNASTDSLTALEKEKRHEDRMKNHPLFREKGKYIISPRAWYMRHWDVVMMVLLMFTSIVTPVEVAFLPTKLNALFFINRCVDFLFVCDIVLNFFVAVPNPVDGQLIFHHGTIIRMYLKGWFPIDVVSVLPYDLISLLSDNSSVSNLKILRILRLLRLMKLLRVLRAGRIFQRIEVLYTIDYSLLELFKFALLAVMSSHWMACAFGMVADIEDSDFSWLHYTSFNSYLVSGRLSEGQDPRGIVPYVELYVAALYWSAMTMSTIGYGDIVPSTTTERVFVSIAMLIGAFIYGYIIGAVSNVIQTRNQKVNRFYQLMGELNAFVAEGNIKQELRVRLREYFKYRLSHSQVEEHTNLLTQLSPALRGEITMQMNTWISKVDFFKECPEALVIQLTMSVREQTFPPQEKILVPGDWCDRMFMVRKGVAICRQKIMTTGSVFCVECLYKEGKVAYSAHAVTFVDLYSFDREVLMNSLNYFPDMKAHFYKLSVKRVFFDETMAYCAAYKELRDKGVRADLSSAMDERPEFYLRKLKMIYGEDGKGIVRQGEKASKAWTEKLNAASYIQRLFRGRRTRIEQQAIATEAGTVGVFSSQIRRFDPTNYAARAIDVLHHRTGQSLYSLHQKMDALLTGGPISTLKGEGLIEGLKFMTPAPASVRSGSAAPSREASMRGGMNFEGPRASGAANLMTPPFGDGGGGGGAAIIPDDARSISSARNAAIAAESAASSASRSIEELRSELRSGLAAMGAGGGSGGGARGGGVVLASGGGGGGVELDKLEKSVGDLATQVGSIMRILSQMSEAQRMFQERSQRSILGHLEQAQARMADQVAKAVNGGAPRVAARRATPLTSFAQSELPPGSAERDVARPTLTRRPLRGSPPPPPPDDTL